MSDAGTFRSCALRAERSVGRDSLSDDTRPVKSIGVPLNLACGRTPMLGAVPPDRPCDCERTLLSLVLWGLRNMHHSNMSSHARFRHILFAVALGSGIAVPSCTDRAQGEDEIIETCEKACPLQFECGYASDDNTLESCLQNCPKSLRERRDKCRADFELTACLGDVSCDEYFEYERALDRPIGTFGAPPAYPCQPETVARLRECFGTDRF